MKVSELVCESRTGVPLKETPKASKPSAGCMALENRIVRLHNLLTSSYIERLADRGRRFLRLDCVTGLGLGLRRSVVARRGGGEVSWRAVNDT